MKLWLITHSCRLFWVWSTDNIISMIDTDTRGISNYAEHEPYGHVLKLVRSYFFGGPFITVSLGDQRVVVDSEVVIATDVII